ncbi:MAG: M12 family metallo-peptidase [Verrucomicrobiota bacterium]
MVRRNESRVALSISIYTLIGSLLLPHSAAAEGHALFAKAAYSKDRSAQTTPTEPTTYREEGVSIDPEMLLEADIELNLFNHHPLPARRTRVIHRGEESMTWIGEVLGARDSLVMLTRHKGVVSGFVHFENQSFQIAPNPEGGSRLRQLNRDALPSGCGNHGIVCPVVKARPDIKTSTVEAVLAPPSATVVDVMIVYTPAAKTRHSLAGIEAMIINGVESVNQTCINSLVNIHFNLVYMGEVDYVETGDMRVTVDEMRNPGDGKMDEVHALRDEYGADIVTIASEDTNFGGWAYIMRNESVAFASNAFSAVHSAQLTFVTLAHEWGHNMGLERGTNYRRTMATNQRNKRARTTDL